MLRGKSDRLLGPAYCSRLRGFRLFPTIGSVHLLLTFERIASALAELDDDENAFRRWLNTPNPELSNHTPLQVLEKGNADVVADIVSSALLDASKLFILF